jgi:hypothetical protein
VGLDVDAGNTVVPQPPEQKPATVTLVLNGQPTPIEYVTGMSWRVLDFIYIKLMLERGIYVREPSDNVELVRNGLVLNHHKQVDDQIKPGDMLYVRRRGDVEA